MVDSRRNSRTERTSRTAARSAPSSRRSSSGGSGRFYRGDEAIRKVDEEAQKAKARSDERQANASKPFRFRVKVNETAQCIILDDKPDFFQYEHTLKGADGYYNLFMGCTKEDDNCPACEVSGKESTYCMYLTVIDLTPFTTRNNETIEFSRKLFVVKNQQQKKLLRMAEREGSLRGALLSCSRDGAKEPAIGNDLELEEFVSEEELGNYIREWTDKEGNLKTEDCSEPYEYETIFEEATTESLRALVGGSPTPGSRAANRSDERQTRRPAARKDRDDWDDPDADGEYVEGEQAEDEKPESTRAAPRRGREAPQRRAPQPAPRPASRNTRRQKASDEDLGVQGNDDPGDDPGDDPDEDNQPRAARPHRVNLRGRRR